MLVAGVAGVVGLKLLWTLVIPVLGLALGFFGLVVKVIGVVLLGWMVLRVLRNVVRRPA